MTDQRSNSHKRLLIYFLLACVTKAIFLFISYPPEGWKSVGYGWELGQIAQNIAEGRGFSSPFEPSDSATAWFAPVVPLLWAAIFKLCGGFSELSLLIILGLQIAVRSLSCVLLIAIAEKIIRRWNLPLTVSSRWCGILAVGICLWPDHLIVTVIPWYTVWQELFTAILFLYCCQWWDQPESVKKATLCGGAAAIVALTNPTPLILYFALLIRITYHQFKERRLLFKSCCYSILCFSLITSPWLLRNFYVFESIIPFRSNFGVELRQGNNKYAGLVQSPRSLHPAFNAQEKLSYQKLGEHIYTQQALEQALNYIAAEPAASLSKFIIRGMLFWLTDSFPVEINPATQNLTLYQKLQRFLRYLQALLPLFIFGFLVITGHLKNIPYVWFFSIVLLFFPLPYYLTQINPAYTHLLKGYLLIITALSFASFLNSKRT